LTAYAAAPGRPDAKSALLAALFEAGLDDAAAGEQAAPAAPATLATIAAATVRTVAN
jgi:hypothetical protein